MHYKFILTIPVSEFESQDTLFKSDFILFYPNAGSKDPYCYLDIDLPEDIENFRLNAEHIQEVGDVDWTLFNIHDREIIITNKKNLRNYHRGFTA